MSSSPDGRCVGHVHACSPAANATALPQHLTALFVLFGALVTVTILQRLGWAYRHLHN
jgi:hypothetical protein